MKKLWEKFMRVLQAIMGAFRPIRVGLNEIFVNQHLQTICIWKVLIPFTLIIIIYPIFLFILKTVHHPFERAFAHGDLLIFSALILMEAAVELKRARLSYDEVLRACAVLAIFLYGFMKFQAMQQEPKLEMEDMDAVNQLFAFSFFNCAVAVCSVAGSIYAFLRVVRSQSGQGVDMLEHPQKSGREG